MSEGNSKLEYLCICICYEIEMMSNIIFISGAGKPLFFENSVFATPCLLNVLQPERNLGLAIPAAVYRSAFRARA